MSISDRDDDGRFIDDRWRTPMGLNPCLFAGFPADYDWTVINRFLMEGEPAMNPPDELSEKKVE